MKNVFNILLIPMLASIFFSDCKMPKLGKRTLCDTVAQYIREHESAVKPVFFEVDPEFSIYTDKHGIQDCYQFSFTYQGVFRKYELWLDEIRFDFVPETPNCRLAGDKVVCYVDQLALGEGCLKKGYGGNRNSYDCIYDHDWTLKARGVVCDSITGPFSDEIRGLSLQCNRPITR